MTLQENISLRAYNTFGIDVRAKYFVEIKSVQDFLELRIHEVFQTHSRLILGGGSNVLFTKDFDGLVIKNNIIGIEESSVSDTEILVKAGGGVIWHDLVLYCIAKNYGGLENLSLIPGLVGAAPMQNIGAYGVEIKDIFYSLEAVELSSGETKLFRLSDCEFGYRESVFKHKFKNQFFITSVTFTLVNLNTPKAVYPLKISYGDIKNTLAEMRVDGTTIKQVSDAVIAIRQSKLPNPKELGNAGSFFKNPTIHKALFDQLIAQYPVMPNYPSTTKADEVKIPAGWLIEQCGWKGKVVGHTGSHKSQALVLVNYGNATGKEVWELALTIQQSVRDKFGITIHPEVNVY